MSVVAVVLVAFEPLAAPIHYTPVADVPSIYRLPAADPGAVVVELPFPPPEAPYRNAPHMLASTLNWRPLLNGYSGFIPPSYAAHYQALRDFPSAASIAALQSFGVTFLFVHVDQLRPGEQRLIDRDARLHRLGAADTIVAYRLDVS